MVAVILNICTFVFVWKAFQQGECSIRKALLRVEKGKYLSNHAMETRSARSGFECGTRCFENESCASVNYKTSGVNKGLCELNLKTRQETYGLNGLMLSDPEFEHIYIIKRVRKISNYIAFTLEQYFFYIFIFFFARITIHSPTYKKI